MMIIRYRDPGGSTSVGVLDGERVFELGIDVAPLLRMRVDELRTAVHSALTGAGRATTGIEILAPIDGRTEVWAAGVTYLTSQSARIEESETAASVYEQVYDADRPELFFKSVAWRVIGDGGEVRARTDSAIDVPEPELALAVNAYGDVIGYSVCNDVSSRSIEAENPLYLPQAKVYNRSCALGPGIVPVWEVDDPYALPLSLSITRAGAVAWDGAASTAQLHRRLDELVGWLYRELEFPDGVWLSTGTCLVPELPFTLSDGDVITIVIDGVGTLTNTVGRQVG